MRFGEQKRLPGVEVMYECMDSVPCAGRAFRVGCARVVIVGQNLSNCSDLEREYAVKIGRACRETVKPMAAGKDRH